MAGKKTVQFNMRITPELAKVLEEEAEKLSWKRTQLAEKILLDWVNQRDKNGGALTFIIKNNNTININGGNA